MDLKRNHMSYEGCGVTCRLLAHAVPVVILISATTTTTTTTTPVGV